MRLQVVTARLAFLLGCAWSPALVHAQATPDVSAEATPAAAPGDIIVTAQRRSQSIQTVPIAITALSGDQLGNKGVTNANQLGQIVPNLQINSAMGDTQPNFALRGVSVANEYNPNQVSPIGVYIDDVNMVNRVGQGGGLYDLQRVEVLRGPQGTLFGRNTTGGAINFITNTPTLSGNRGYAEAGYGNFNTFKAQGALETTMVEDELGFRVAATYEKGDGKFRNIYPGQPDAGSVDSLQVRGTLHIRPGAGPLDIVIKAYASRANGTQQPIKGLAATAAPGFFEINENRIGQNRTRQYGTSAKISYELSPRLSFTSITAIGNGLLDAAFDADGSPLDILDLQQKAKFDQFSEEARFNYEGKAVKAVAGVFYGWDKTVSDNGFDIGSAIAPGVDGGFFQHFRQVRRTYAVFGQTDVNLTPRLVATIGLRYSADRSAYDDGYAYLFMGAFGGTRTPLFTTVPCTTGVGTCPYDANARYAIKGRNNALTGRAALTYTFDSGTLLYASYNRGYRSGAFNGGGYTNSAGITYIKPEYVNAYEIGAKGRFLDRRLSLALAAFYYDYQNQQLQDTRPGPVSFLLNAPKSESYGFEGEATYRASSRFSVNASVGYLHATYKELTLSGTNLAGNDLPFAPRWTAQGGFDWAPLDIAGGPLTFSPNLNYVSRQFFSPFNAVNAAGGAQVNSELQQGAYVKVNGAITWTRGNVTLRAWVQNLLQEKTLAYGLDLRGAGFPFNYLVPAQPRTYGGSVRFTF